MQGDRMLLVVVAVGVVLAAAVGVLVSPVLAAIPVVLALAAVLFLRRRALGAEDYEDWDDEDEYEYDTVDVEDEGEIQYVGPSSGGLATWQPPVDLVEREPVAEYDDYGHHDTYVSDDAAPSTGGYADYEPSTSSWDATDTFAAEPQEFEPLPIWNTFEVEEVVEDVQSDEDILAASQQSALHVTEALSEEEVQRVNQELLSKVHSLLSKYE